MDLIKDKITIINKLFICPYCGKSFRALAYHTRQVHKISGKQLRKLFNLPQNYSLQTPELKQQRRIKALENNMDKQLILAGSHTRFKKGMKCSKQMIKNISEGHKIKRRKIITED